MTFFEYIEKDKERLLKKIQLIHVRQYFIYKEYLKKSSIQSKMDRYSHVSEDIGVSERTVINAVKEMEKSV